MTIEKFLASMPYSPATRSAYCRALSDLERTFPDLAALTAADLLGFVERPTWGNSQRYVTVTACKTFLRWRFGADHPALAARVRRRKSRRQRSLSSAEALRLLAHFDSYRPKGARDLAICCLALDTGLRASELCRLKLADLDLEKRSLQVIVKGGQWGFGVYSDGTRAALDRWLSLRDSPVGAPTVFVSTRGGRPLTREGLQTIVKKWGLELGIKLSPHDLRRSFATLATTFGAPTRLVQEAGRWSTIEMVEHYTRNLDPLAITPYLPVSRLLEG